MKKVAIIPARGGSKRIPRKNIKEFCGKPILAYSVEAAVQSGLFDEVMVSTDDEEIAAIARQYGATVPFFRTEKTANDFATITEVLLEVLEEYDKRGQHFEVASCIYPTAPFVTAEKLQKAMETFENADADSVIPVVSFSYPPQRALVERDGRLVFCYPEYINSRSQDMEKHFHDVGQFYVFRSESLKKNGSIMRGNILPLEVSELEVQDIDNMTDWQIAEMKYRLMSEK